MKQRGVVLIMVLVLLLAVTLMGTVVIQNATLQTRMVTNTQARQQAFNSAEAILAKAENDLAATPPNTKAKIEAKFKSSCDGGYCFMGTIGTFANQQRDCNLGATVAAKELWEKNAAVDVWGTANKHATFKPPNMEKTGMYIVEFRCFVDGAYKVSDEKGDMLFRITARAFSDNGDAVVMLQSTYRMSGYSN